MRTLHDLTADYCAKLQAAGVSAETAQKWERRLVLGLEKEERWRRAAELTAQHGAREAARIQGCSLSSGYRRLHKGRDVRVKTFPIQAAKREEIGG